MTHVTCRLTAKNRDQLRIPALGNRVWATSFYLQQRLSVAGTSVQRSGITGRGEQSARINPIRHRFHLPAATPLRQQPGPHVTGQQRRDVTGRRRDVTGRQRCGRLLGFGHAGRPSSSGRRRGASAQDLPCRPDVPICRRPPGKTHAVVRHEPVPSYVFFIVGAPCGLGSVVE